MVILGSLDALWGLAAILNNEVVVVGGHGALIFDLTTWGWVQLILGVLVGLTGLGLLVGNAVARVLGISLLAINAILQIVWFSAASLWAFLKAQVDAKSAPMSSTARGEVPHLSPAVVEGRPQPDLAG